MRTSVAIAGQDSRPDLEPVYCYAIREVEGNTNFFLSNFDNGVEIAGLPEKWDAAEPQAFNPASINHGGINKEDGISEQSFQVNVEIQDAEAYSRYILFSMIPKMEVLIFKVTAGAAREGEVAGYGVDTLVVHSGLITDFAMEGFQVTITAVPEPFLTNHSVPRWKFSRSCNHQLYGSDCGVDREGYQFSNSIISMDEGNRQITISGELGGGITGEYWRGGVLVHQKSGTKLTIFDAEINGGNTVVTLHQWNPDIDVTDIVVINAGCDHTVKACEEKFENLPNFGGFPNVPNKNPTIHGVD